MNDEFVDIERSELLEFLSLPKRYKIGFGGRSALKSWGFGQELIIQGYERPLTILCAREIQRSIKKSVLKLLSNTIKRCGLEDFYDVQRTAIYGINGTEFMFEGLFANVGSIKSAEDIDIVWVEEAETTSEDTWDTLIPTIRKPGSEIWITFNARLETDPTYQNFIVPYLKEIIKNGYYEDEDFFIRKTSYKDNIWLSEETKKDIARDKKRDYDKYLHIWEGECKAFTEARIFKNWRIEDFESPKDATFMYGADWGFAEDPATLNRMWFDHDKKILYLDYEANKVGCEIDHLPDLFDKVPGSRKHLIRADSARPETISYLNRNGFKIKGAKKGKGSIEDGVEFMKSWDIVVHPRCKHTIYELTNYSYKQDKLTNDILPIIIDKDNHHMDSIRYGSEPLWNKAKRFNG